MSADNGVYVLATPDDNGGTEYRIAHLQAIENIDWGRCPIHGSDCHYGNDGREDCEQCHKNAGYNSDPDNTIANAREIWGNAKVYTEKSEALMAAADVYASLDVCEYGICILEVPRKF